MTHDPEPLSSLLEAVNQVDESARDRLWSAVYEELLRMAREQLDREPPGRDLDATELVHEAFLRLTGNEPIEWANRRHFFAAAASAMRRIRVDSARGRMRLKRGGGTITSPLGDSAIEQHDPTDALAVDEAISRLQQLDPRKAEVVMLRWFAGLTTDECAEALDVSPRTVDNEWRFARAWLSRQLSEPEAHAPKTKPQFTLCIDKPNVTADDIAKVVHLLDELYRELGGDRLTVKKVASVRRDPA